MINAGLHFHHRSDYETVLRRALKLMEEFRQLHHDNVVVFVETTSQHFPSATGGWCERHKLADDSPIKQSLETFTPVESHWNVVSQINKYENYSCVPLMTTEDATGKKRKKGNRSPPVGAPVTPCDEQTQWQLQWRNEMARIIITKEFPRIAIAPLGALTMPFWDLHIGKNDCTHYCYSPPLVEAAASLLIRSVTWADKRNIVERAQAKVT